MKNSSLMAVVLMAVSCEKTKTEQPAGASVVYKTKELLPSSDGLQVVEIGTFTALGSVKT